MFKSQDKKLRYVKTSRDFVVFFVLISLYIVIVNIAGYFIEGLNNLNPLNFIYFILISIALLGVVISDLNILFGFKDFDLKQHIAIFKQFHALPIEQKPSIDVFLPVCGEDIEILRRTWEAVANLDYPKERLKVFVLDDKRDTKVMYLAQQYNFIYLSRPNRGEFKKAGNLKYGFDNSTSEFITIFDADFAPKREFLLELLPYHLIDQKIGIVQSPQSFEINEAEPAYIQKGDISIQEFFYRIIQPARSRFNAAICVGTNAIYRRKALNDAGGFYQIEHSEDSHTGLNLLRAGYYLKYIPIILAVGFCPADYVSLFKQRTRWCQGSLTLATSKLFKETKMSWMGRLSYFSGFLYYLNSFLMLLLPFHLLFILYLPDDGSSFLPLFFLPNVLFILISLPFFVLKRPHISALGNQFFFHWAYIYVIIKRFILRKNEEWIPTGAKIQKNASYSTVVKLTFAYLTLYWGIAIWVIFNTPHLNTTVTTFIAFFWIGFNLLTHLGYLYGLIVTYFYHKQSANVSQETLGKMNLSVEGLILGGLFNYSDINKQRDSRFYFRNPDICLCCIFFFFFFFF